MGSLIRPALFMVARIGLVLSVAAWVVGQWRFINFRIPVMHYTCKIELGDLGCVFAFGNMVPANRFRVYTSLPRETGSLFDLVNYLDGYADGHAARSIDGIGAVLTRPAEVWCFWHHWINVTLFALFYGVLKWVYRKRGKTVADE